MTQDDSKHTAWMFWLRVLMVSGLAVLAGLTSQVRGVENMCLDFWLTHSGRLGPPDDIVVVAIDEPSFQELRQPWPWPRSLHARLVDALTRAGAAVIVFDVIFADPSAPDEDQALAVAMERSGIVILASTQDVAASGSFYRKIMVEPLDSLRLAASGVGLAMITPDPDGVVRRFQTVLDGRTTLPAMALARLRAEEPTARSGLIDFAGPSMSVPHISYYQVVDPEHPLPEHLVRGKTVFIGRSLAATPDPTRAPDSFRVPSTAMDGRYMAGVEIHAQILHTMLHGRSGHEASIPVRLAVGCAALVIGAWLLSGQSAFRTVIWGLGLTATLLGGSYAIYAWARLWFPPAALAAGQTLLAIWNLAEGYLMAARQRAWIRNAFGKYISPTVVEMLMNHPEQLTLGGTEVEATVMFMDLEGFTTLSESLSPADLVALLSEVFAPMVEIIKQEHGTLDKFIGDAIMAFWGAPLPMADHARRAALAALAMQTKMNELSAAIVTRGGPKIRARIGLHSGALVVGNIGGREQFNYTCLGDTVNLASRLEAANKVYGTRVLLSQETAQGLGPEFLIRPLGQLRVKGRQEPVRLVELLGQNGTRPDWLRIFENAWELYLRGEFDMAADMFAAVLAERPEDGPSQVLRERCLRFQAAPPHVWTDIWSAEHNRPEES